jgi:GNAT superfamily N-acetyltransferase
MIFLQPAVPLPGAPVAGTFVQTLFLQDGERVLGRAVWSAADPSQGVIQILELWIDPPIRRGGHGRRLLRGVIEQARAYHKLGKQKNVRRLWVGIGHKSRVVGRAFLTGEGFHHISTTGGLLQDEDQLIYVKSLD